VTTTLRGRLQLALGACLVAFSLLLWFAGNRTLEALARDLVAAQLADSAESLLAALDFGADGVPALRQVAPEYDKPFSGHYFRIEANGHALQSRSLWDENLTLAAPATGRFDLLRVTGPQAQPLGWQNAAGNVLGLYLHGLFEDPSILQALFGAAVPTLDSVFDGLADFVEQHFAPGVLQALVAAP